MMAHLATKPYTAKAEKEKEKYTKAVAEYKAKGGAADDE